MKHFFPFLFLLSTLFPASSFGQGKPNFVGEWYQRASQGKAPVRADVFSKKQSDFPKRNDTITNPLGFPAGRSAVMSQEFHCASQILWARDCMNGPST